MQMLSIHNASLGSGPGHCVWANNHEWTGYVGKFAISSQRRAKNYCHIVTVIVQHRNEFIYKYKEYRGSQLTFLGGWLVLNKLFSLLTLHDHYLERDECMDKNQVQFFYVVFIDGESLTEHLNQRSPC